MSDEPWNLNALDLVNVDLDWRVGALEYFRSTDRDVELALTLTDGDLAVDRFRGEGSLNGTIDGTGKLTKNPKGHRLELDFHVADGMINLAGKGADPEQYTPIDLELSLSWRRTIAPRSDGEFQRPGARHHRRRCHGEGHHRQGVGGFPRDASQRAQSLCKKRHLTQRSTARSSRHISKMGS